MHRCRERRETRYARAIAFDGVMAGRAVTGGWRRAGHGAGGAAGAIHRRRAARLGSPGGRTGARRRGLVQRGSGAAVWRGPGAPSGTKGSGWPFVCARWAGAACAVGCGSRAGAVAGAAGRAGGNGTKGSAAPASGAVGARSGTRVLAARFCARIGPGRRVRCGVRVPGGRGRRGGGAGGRKWYKGSVRRGCRARRAGALWCKEFCQKGGEQRPATSGGSGLGPGRRRTAGVRVGGAGGGGPACGRRVPLRGRRRSRAARGRGPRRRHGGASGPGRR